MGQWSVCHGIQWSSYPYSPFITDIICQNERLVKIYGDQSYAGVFTNEVEKHKIKFKKAAGPESIKGFVPVAKRWLGERTIAWSNRTGDPVLPKNCQRL